MPEKTFRAILHVLRVGLHEANHLGLDNAFALFQCVSVLCDHHRLLFIYMYVGPCIHLLTQNSQFEFALMSSDCAETTPGRGDYGCNSPLAYRGTGGSGNLN